MWAGARLMTPPLRRMPCVRPPNDGSGHARVCIMGEIGVYRSAAPGRALGYQHHGPHRISKLGGVKEGTVSFVSLDRSMDSDKRSKNWQDNLAATVMWWRGALVALEVGQVDRSKGLCAERENESDEDRRNTIRQASTVWMDRGARGGGRWRAVHAAVHAAVHGRSTPS